VNRSGFRRYPDSQLRTATERRPNGDQITQKAKSKKQKQKAKSKNQKAKTKKPSIF